MLTNTSLAFTASEIPSRSNTFAMWTPLEPPRAGSGHAIVFASSIARLNALGSGNIGLRCALANSHADAGRGKIGYQVLHHLARSDQSFDARTVDHYDISSFATLKSIQVPPLSNETFSLCPVARSKFGPRSNMTCRIPTALSTRTSAPAAKVCLCRIAKLANGNKTAKPYKKRDVERYIEFFASTALPIVPLRTLRA